MGEITVQAPMVLGHESAGTIVEIGSAVRRLRVGDRVALEPGFPCRRCRACLSGKYNLCPDVQFAATPPVDGTLCGFYVAPEDFCYPLPEHVSVQEGALAEPLAVAVHIMNLAHLQYGQTVAVMGAGPVGLLCCAVAKAHHAAKIISVDINPQRLAFAQTYAATHTFAPEAVPADASPAANSSPAAASALANAARLLSSTETPEGIDVVIDATGSGPAIQLALHIIRRGGHYVQAGMGRNWIDFPIAQLCTKEVTATGCFRYSSGDFERAVAMIRDGRVNVAQLISSQVDFGHAERAFDLVARGEGIKTVIRGPNEPPVSG